MSTDPALDPDGFLVERQNGGKRQLLFYESEETAHNVWEHSTNATITACKVVPHTMWVGLIHWCKLVCEDFIGQSTDDSSSFWQRNRVQKLRDLLNSNGNPSRSVDE